MEQDANVLRSTATGISAGRLPRSESVSAQLNALVRDAYFWPIVMMALLCAIFASAPQEIGLLRLPPVVASAIIDVSIPAYRVLFTVTAAVTAWHFGPRGGLIACAAMSPILVLKVWPRAADPSAWVEVAVAGVGVLFAFVAGRQGKMQNVLRETTSQLRKEIAERKQSEEALLVKTALLEAQSETTLDGVIAVDTKRAILLYNRRLQEMWRIPPGLLSSRMFRLVYRHMIGMRKDPEAAQQQVEEVFANPERKARYEAPLADGRVLDAFTAPLVDSAGVLRGRIWYFRDITESKEMEHRMMMTDRLASIGELVSGVAHELNNPLAGVIGFAQLVAQKDVSDDVREDLSMIQSEAERAARIIKDLLTFARKHGPPKQKTQVNTAIEDVLRLRAYDQRLANIEIVKRLAADLPEIMADHHQLQQVFFNIVINAEYAMVEAHGRGRLMISTEKLDRYARVTFSDDGPGIPEQNLSRLFEPFFTTKPPGKGTGLGLSICHRIVTEHGGRIYARSQPGEGAQFIIELPLDGSLS